MLWYRLVVSPSILNPPCLQLVVLRVGLRLQPSPLVRLALPQFRRLQYIAGFLRGAVGSWGVRARADATTSDAAPPAADMLSLATWVTGLALFPRGQVPPYHDLLDWG